MRIPRWRLRAACANEWELFHGPDAELPTRQTAREHKAIQICATCPVQPECRAYAIDHGMQFGIWGGWTESELRDRTRPVRPRQGDGEGIYDLSPAQAAILWAQVAANRQRVRLRMEEGKKLCPGCGAVKRLDEDFGRDSRSPDGRTARCKECRNAEGRESRRKEHAA